MTHTVAIHTPRISLLGDEADAPIPTASSNADSNNARSARNDLFTLILSIINAKLTHFSTIIARMIGLFHKK